MKKGLVLTLVLMAMVALVTPVSAMAPIIQELPTVIIGDAGDSHTGTQTVYLMRYLNAVDLSSASVIQRRNGYTDDKFHVYFSQDAAEVPQVAASGPPGGAIVSGLTPAEASDLINGVAAPPAGAEIVDGAGGYFWLSLINTTINPGATSAYDLAPDVDGVLRPYPANSADPGTATLTIYALEDDLPTTLVAVDTMVVVSISDANDGYFGGLESVYSADFEGDTDGWLAVFQGDGTTLIEATPVESGTAIGFQGRSDAPSGGELGVWNTWFMSDDGTAPKFLLPGDQATMGTDIYQLRALCSSTAGSPANSPGYRIFYTNRMFTHFGGMMVLTFDFMGDSILAPSATTGDVQARVYWAPPYDMNEMADGEGMESLLGADDARDYSIMFDIIDIETADTGVVAMESIDIYTMPRPADATADIAWGTGGTNFNDGTLGWVAATAAPDATFSLGTAVVNAGNFTLNCGTGTDGYAGVAPDLTTAPSIADVSVPQNANALTRVSLTMSTSNVNATPNFRVLVTDLSDTLGLLSPMWFDMYMSVVIKGVYAPGTLYGVPKTSGSDIETYAYGHTPGTGANAGNLLPSVDAYHGGAMPNGWPTEDATYTCTYLGVEEGV
jgi:hypothetical protein